MEDMMMDEEDVLVFQDQKGPEFLSFLRKLIND
jgi:hypothetical protein